MKRGEPIAIIENCRIHMQAVVDNWEQKPGNDLAAQVRNLMAIDGPIAACDEAIEWWENDE
jgi:hypothetical protein